MGGPGEGASKAEWRRWVRALPPPGGADEVQRQLHRFLGPAPGVVATYEPLPGEIDLTGLLDPLGATRVLPRLDGEVVTWHLDDGSLVDPADLDVVLVPGRLFDRRGVRLGRGGGHYDRFLPRLRPGVPAVGVTVDDRVVPRLPSEPHDVPMSHLATESGVRAVR